jgi:hypothetical protein
LATLQDFLGSLRLYDGKYATVENATMHFSTDHYKINPTTPTETARKEAFFMTCLHEMWHCIGGGLWNGDYRIITDMGILGRYKLPSFPTALTPAFPHNNVTTIQTSYRGSLDPATVRYTGTEGLKAWRETMVGQQNSPGIFIENVNVGYSTTMAQMGGTAGSHWKMAQHLSRADYANGWKNPIVSAGTGSIGGLTGITDMNGNDIRNELAVGWMGTNYSQIWCGWFTVQCLKDIGYDTDLLPLTIPLIQYKSA